MISSLSRFGSSLPAYSTRPAFTPTTENSKALGVSSRANTQRQGFSIFTLATMAYATGKETFKVGMQDPKIREALNRIVDGHSVSLPVYLPLGSRNQPREIVPFLKEHFESVFPNSPDPLTVLQGWLKGKEKQRISPIEEETLRAYVEDCAFYADHLGDLTQLDDWVKHIEANLKSGKSLTQTEQRRWDSYNMWALHEYFDFARNDQKRARGLLFKNLIPKLEALLTPVQAK
jgi:hypothetical protein